MKAREEDIKRSTEKDKIKEREKERNSIDNNERDDSKREYRERI